MWNPVQDARGNWLQTLLTFACSSGFLLFGYDQGVFSGVIVTPYFLNTFNKPSSTLLGIVNALYDVGGALGALICLIYGSRLGRKRVILMGCFIGTVGAVLTGTAKTMAQLLVGRIVAGTGVGQLTATIGIWQAETAQAHNRGKLMSIELLLCCVGIFLAQWINYGFGSIDSAAAFQFPILFQIIFLVATFALVPFLPESPRWLVSRGRLDEASEALVRLGTKDVTAQSSEVQKTMLEMEAVARLEDIDGWQWFLSLFRGGPTQNGKRVLMAVLINVFQQLTGINSVTYYVPTLLITFIGVARSEALWIAGLISIIAIIFSMIPVFFIDRFGRIRFLLVGAVLQGLWFFIISGLYANLPRQGTAAAKSIGTAIVSFVYIYFATFASCWLAPSWMYAPEILPLKGRSHGMGLATVFLWLFNFMIVLITPPAIKNISWRYYLILGIFNICFVPFLLFFFVETKGKSLEDLDRYFAERYHDGRELHEAQRITQAKYNIDNPVHSEGDWKLKSEVTTV